MKQAKEYDNEEKVVGNRGEEKTGNCCPSSYGHETAEKIAEQNKVSEKTVRTAETFSKDVDEVSKNTGIKTLLEYRYTITSKSEKIKAVN